MSNPRVRGRTSIAAWIAAACATLLLAACGSTPPTNWYLLSAESATPAAAGPTLGIVSLDVAEYLLSAQVLAMEDANRVRRAEFARWAEPLDEGVARVLALDLAAALGSPGVRLAPWPREWVPQHELRLRIQQLDVRGDSAVLVAAWSLADGTQRTPGIDRLTQLTRPRSGSDAAATAADFSALLADLARAIAAEIPAEPPATAN